MAFLKFNNANNIALYFYGALWVTIMGFVHSKVTQCQCWVRGLDCSEKSMTQELKYWTMSSSTCTKDCFPYWPMWSTPARKCKTWRAEFVQEYNSNHLEIKPLSAIQLCSASNEPKLNVKSVIVFLWMLLHYCDQSEKKKHTHTCANEKVVTVLSQSSAEFRVLLRSV